MWSIDPNKLRERVIEYGVDPAQAELVPNLILHRFAQDGGSAYSFKIDNLQQEISDALRNRRHWIHTADRKVVAATFMALASLTDQIGARSVPEAKEILRKIDSSDERWQTFVKSFHREQVLMQYPMIAGVVEIMGGVGSGLAHLFTNGATLMVHAGDTADIRLKTLITKALQSFARLRPPAMQTVETQREVFTTDGLPPPPTHAEAVGMATTLHELAYISDDAELITQLNPDTALTKSLNGLLYYLAAYGKPAVAKTATEALMLLSTQKYQERAKAPLGYPTSHFPQVDGTNRDEVLTFLRERLNVPITTEKERDAVWTFWKEAWDDPELTAVTATWDQDDTLLLYRAGDGEKSGPAWGWVKGIEHVRLREVMIQLVAIALRDKTPVPITTTCSASRFADVANAPGLAPLKFATTLRLPEDPPITVEELLSFSSIRIYETAVQRTLSRLRPLTAEEQQDALLQALTIAALRSGSGYPKDPGTAASGRGRQANILVENKEKNVKSFTRGGGAAGLLVPEPGHRVDQRNQGVPDIWGALKRVDGKVRSGKAKPGFRQIFGAYANTSFLETDFPPMQAFIDHPDWLLKVFSSWVKYALLFTGQKLGFIYFSRAGRALVALAKQPITLTLEPERPALLPPAPVPIFPEGEMISERELDLFPYLDLKVLEGNKIALLFNWSDPFLGLSKADLDLIKEKGFPLLIQAVEEGQALEGYADQPGETQIILLVTMLKVFESILSGYDALALYAALKRRKITASRIQMVVETLQERAKSFSKLPPKFADLLKEAPEGKKRPARIRSDEDLLYSRLTDAIDKKYVERYFPNLDLEQLSLNPVGKIFWIRKWFFALKKGDLILLRRYAGEPARTMLTQLRILRKPFADVAYGLADKIDQLGAYDRLFFYLALCRGVIHETNATAFFQSYLDEASRAASSEKEVSLIDILSPLPKSEAAANRRSKARMPALPTGALAIRNGPAAAATVLETSPAPSPGESPTKPKAHLGARIMAGDSGSFDGTAALQVGIATLAQAEPVLAADLADDETEAPKDPKIVGLSSWKRTHPWATALRGTHTPIPGTTARILLIK